ncbi:MAG: hypothetical protein AAFN10_27965 [Bacteroidota bacterium]
MSKRIQFGASDKLWKRFTDYMETENILEGAEAARKAVTTFLNLYESGKLEGVDKSSKKEAPKVPFKTPSTSKEAIRILEEDPNFFAVKIPAPLQESVKEMRSDLYQELNLEDRQILKYFTALHKGMKVKKLVLVELPPKIKRSLQERASEAINEGEIRNEGEYILRELKKYWDDRLVAVPVGRDLAKKIKAKAEEAGQTVEVYLSSHIKAMQSERAIHAVLPYATKERLEAASEEAVKAELVQSKSEYVAMMIHKQFDENTVLVSTNGKLGQKLKPRYEKAKRKRPDLSIDQFISEELINRFSW